MLLSTITLSDYLVLSGLLFSIGVFGVLTRKNAIAVLMGIELMLNAANINLVAFSKFIDTGLNGQIFALFSIVIAAAEVAVALAIVISIYKTTRTIDLDKEDTLKG
ncbi:MAG: NADH-quinone oxidoreductase subunit NuoK [Deltaproteobacteria bacterium]|nr:NADH-quinone oxidoreductase subunit NuoK [Deltaproteobacteria bacterium]